MTHVPGQKWRRLYVCRLGLHVHEILHCTVWSLEKPTLELARYMRVCVQAYLLDAQLKTIPNDMQFAPQPLRVTCMFVHA